MLTFARTAYRGPMIRQTAVSDGLGLLIRNALSAAFESGRHDVVHGLQAALSAAESPSKAAYELDVLAGEVRLAGRIITLSRGERALLIALALSRRAQTRAELVELLYPHLDEGTAGIQLRVYVHRVRRRLGDARTVLFESDAYRLGGNVHVDFWEIEAEAAAAMKVKDRLDSGVTMRLNAIRLRLRRRDTSWARDLEWALALERRLQSLLFDVTTRLGEAALAEHDLLTASRFAAESLDLDPCDERGAELAIRVHLAAGDPQAALRAFRRYERVLKEEFAAQPSSDLSALVLVRKA
jgi:DNA-binding SARP family transcriptional activator